MPYELHGGSSGHPEVDEGVWEAIVGCEVCWAERMPTGPRKSEQHFAIRFGDWPAEVTYRGVKLFNVFEVIAGPGGEAWFYWMGPKHQVSFCPCGSGKAAMGYRQADHYTVSIRVGSLGRSHPVDASTGQPSPR